MTLDPAREAALLEQARSGGAGLREAAFEEIFKDLREPLLALCLHLTGSAADAEDALQEAFLGVHQGLARFRGESRLYTWAYRITIRAALRVKGRRGPRPRPLETEPIAPAAPDALVDQELSERIALAMARLPDEQRIVISLFAVEGLAHREIATILGVPEGTIWSRLHLARKKLAAALVG